jgi:hypothetical protein
MLEQHRPLATIENDTSLRRTYAMTATSRFLLIASVLLVSAPALSQASTDDEPPPLAHRFTLRASGGVAFASSGYYCGYYNTYYETSYTCSGGYVAAWPDVNLDLDVWFSRALGVTLGANVMWGTYTPTITAVAPTPIYTTTWEPHADLLLAIPGNAKAKGRIRLGFGLLLTSEHGLNTTGNTLSYNEVGGAVRVGIGASFIPNSKVGFAIDAIFEAGWLGNSYASTVQLLIGPELHF